MNKVNVWSDVEAWQGLLDRYRTLFEPLVAGAAVGLLPRSVADASNGEMMVWARNEDGMVVQHRPFAGFADCGVSLLFVAEPEAMEGLHAMLPENPLGGFKLMIRKGDYLLYVLTPKTKLLDDGFEDFLEALGLAFLGACR